MLLSNISLCFVVLLPFSITFIHFEFIKTVYLFITPDSHSSETEHYELFLETSTTSTQTEYSPTSYLPFLTTDMELKTHFKVAAIIAPSWCLIHFVSFDGVILQKMFRIVKKREEVIFTKYS